MSEAAETHPPLRAPSPMPPSAGEQRFLIHGVSWKDYVLLRETLDLPGLRMTYLEGALELMSPSPRHEDEKTTIARLVELHALERNIALYGYGNATFRKEAEERGLEPDECWVVGGKLQEVPDVALEVVVTRSAIDKLSVYSGLGVREVWFWEEGAFHLHALRDDGYASIERSELLPDLDFDVIARFVQLADQHEAVRGYRDWLRAQGR